MTKPDLPAEGTAEYLWWSQGARDNQDARDEGLTSVAKDMIAGIADLARLRNRLGDRQDPAYFALILAKMYCPEKLRRRYR